MRKDYLENGYLMPKERVRRESYPKYEPSNFSRGEQLYGFTRNCGVIIKLERFSHLLSRSSMLGSLIRLRY